MADVVAFTFSPKIVSGVQAKVPASVPHENTPGVLAFTSQAAEFRAETTRLVVEAVSENVNEVVEANGNTDEMEVVATKYPAYALLPRSDSPSTESLRPGDVVPMPTLPFERIVSFSVNSL